MGEAHHALSAVTPGSERGPIAEDITAWRLRPQHIRAQRGKEPWAKNRQFAGQVEHADSRERPGRIRTGDRQPLAHGRPRHPPGGVDRAGRWHFIAAEV